jgi:hypothetical protein
MMRAFRSPILKRVVFAVICLMVVLTGAGNMVQGRMDYQNYKGFSVFAPFGILVGALGLILAIWRPAFFAPAQKDHHRDANRPDSPKHSQRKRR